MTYTYRSTGERSYSHNFSLLVSLRPATPAQMLIMGQNLEVAGHGVTRGLYRSCNFTPQQTVSAGQPAEQTSGHWPSPIGLSLETGGLNAGKQSTAEAQLNWRIASSKKGIANWNGLEPQLCCQD